MLGIVYMALRLSNLANSLAQDALLLLLSVSHLA